MLFCTQLTKSFGTQTLFDEAGFQINSGERVGIVGRNGCGKSTLGRIILGQDTPDDGEINFPDGYKIGGLDQHLVFEKETIVEEVSQSLDEDQPHDIWKAEKLLSGLGFKSTDFTRHPSEFSGGYQIRIKLAQLLLSEPDCLILDEPTNYLDILTIRWLERFLSSWRQELICISHDQTFLENITTHTIAVHRQKCKKIKGTPKKCYQQIDREEELHERTRKKQELETKKQEKFIREFRSGARSAGLVQSRIKMLEKKNTLDTLPPLQPIKFRFTEANFNGAKVLDAHNLTFGYEEGQDLLKKLTFELHPGDKVGIIGANGKGKSTLLKIINNEFQQVSGTLKLNPNTHIGYMGQSNVQVLDPEKTIIEELQTIKGTSEQVARSIAGNLLFSGGLAFKPIQVLSGGEKSRVNLGKILLTRLNCLLLDEPTNHLDYESVDALIEATQKFGGSVIFVSHNETFLRSVAQKLIVFDGDEVYYYPASYETFLAEKGFQSELELKKNPLGAPPIESSNTGERANKKHLEKLLRPLKRELSKIEKEILKLETEQADNVEKFNVAQRQGNRIKMDTLGIEYQKISAKVDTKWEQWNTIGAQAETIEKELLSLQS